MIFLALASDNAPINNKSTEVKVTIDVAEAAQHYPIWRNTPNCPTNISMGEDVNVSFLILFYQIFNNCFFKVNTIFAECYAESGTNPDNPIAYR